MKFKCYVNPAFKKITIAAADADEAKEAYLSWLKQWVEPDDISADPVDEEESEVQG